MQDLSLSMILLNGTFKTRQIASIAQKGCEAYSVRFKNNSRVYTYSADKVIWTTNPKWINPNLAS